MVVVGGIDPAIEGGGGGGVEEGLGDELMDEGIVALGEGEVAGLAMQLVTNGNLAQDDVGQRIDEVGRAREIVVARLDGGFETAIGYTRRRLPEEQDGTTLVECGMCTLLLEEESSFWKRSSAAMKPRRLSRSIL